MGTLEAEEGWTDEARLERRLRLRELVRQLEAEGWGLQEIGDRERFLVEKSMAEGKLIRALLHTDDRATVRAELIAPPESLFRLPQFLEFGFSI
ncbi:MAG: hypothetical protein QM758_03170 [Armatimonas sp.]